MRKQYSNFACYYRLLLSVRNKIHICHKSALAYPFKRSKIHYTARLAVWEIRKRIVKISITILHFCPDPDHIWLVDGRLKLLSHIPSYRRQYQIFRHKKYTNYLIKYNFEMLKMKIENFILFLNFCTVRLAKSYCASVRSFCFTAHILTFVSKYNVRTEVSNLFSWLHYSLYCWKGEKICAYRELAKGRPKIRNAF